MRRAIHTAAGAWVFACKRFTTRTVATGNVRYRKGQRPNDFGDEITRCLFPPDEYVKWDPAIVGRGSDPVLEAAFRKLGARLFR